MEPNWIIIITIVVSAIALLIYLIIRNQKDKDELVKKIIDEDEKAIPKTEDTEVESND